MRIKLLQYKEGSTAFKVKEVVSVITPEKFIPCEEKKQIKYYSRTKIEKKTINNELKTFIKR